MPIFCAILNVVLSFGIAVDIYSLQSILLCATVTICIAGAGRPGGIVHVSRIPTRNMKTITIIILLISAFSIAGRADLALYNAKRDYCEPLHAAVTEGKYQRIMPADIIECNNAGIPLPVSIETITAYHAYNNE